MTVEISVGDSDDESTPIRVLRSETVQLASLSGAATDVMDLVRATMDRLTDDVHRAAGEQLAQFRSLVEQAENA